MKKNIGKKIRLLRGSMTQAELAGRSGVDKAIISKIESGKMTGSLRCHRKLADVFGLKLSELYAYLEEEKYEPVEFHSGNSKADYYQDFLELLTSLPLSKKMLPTFITLKPAQEKLLEETLKKVERFIIVLKGEMEIKIEGKLYRLKKELDHKRGDSLYSLSPKSHRIKNPGSSVAQALCISCPPVL